MKLMIMAVQFKGGSLQGVVSIIRELVKFSENEYHIVISKEVKKQLDGIFFPDNFKFYDLEYKTSNRTINLFLNRHAFSVLEERIRPNCVVCTSGPMYWTPKSLCLMGYNLAHHLYLDSPYFYTIGAAAKIRWFLRRKFHRFYFRREGDAFFVQTDDVNERLRKYINREEVYTVPNTYSVSYRDVETYPNKLGARKMNEIRCLTISAYYPHKNLGVIRPVVDELIRRGYANVKFIVTLQAEHYHSLFPASYHENVINVGFVPSKEGPSLYEECDIMFLPTLLECFSASYAEAMVMGKPIVTSDMGFAHTVCKDAALYFDPVDVMSIVDRLLLLINNDSLREELVEKGRKQLAQFGTSEDRAKEILRLCQKLNEKKDGKKNSIC